MEADFAHSVFEDRRIHPGSAGVRKTKPSKKLTIFLSKSGRLNLATECSSKAPQLNRE